MHSTLFLITVSAMLAATSSAAVAASIKANKGPSRMAIKYGEDPTTYSGTSYQTLPGSGLTVTIPSGQSGYLVATFQAESVAAVFRAPFVQSESYAMALNLTLRPGPISRSTQSGRPHRIKISKAFR
jgi:hypothetical protein